MKILSNKQYNDLINENKCTLDTYNQDVTVLKLENKDYELILKSCKGMFGAVTDDMLLRENALLYEENKQLKSILTELEEWLKETRINSAFIDEQTIMEVQLKIQELKEKYK